MDKDLVAAVGKAIKGARKFEDVAEEGREAGALCAACQRCGAALEGDAAQAGAPEDGHERRHA